MNLRGFRVPGVLFLLVAFVLLLLVSISLPWLTALDIVRTSFNGGTTTFSDSSMNEIRLGIWAPCHYDVDGSRTCEATGHGYSVGVTSPNGGDIRINGSWTRGLAIHPVAAAVTFIALLLSFSTHLMVTLIASIMAFLAAAITLIAFAVDIALFVYTRREMKKLPGVNANTNTGAGFWMTFVSLILLLLAGCTVCFGRRRDSRRLAGSTVYPATTEKRGFMSRFRRNRV